MDPTQWNAFLDALEARLGRELVSYGALVDLTLTPLQLRIMARQLAIGVSLEILLKGVQWQTEVRHAA